MKYRIDPIHNTRPGFGGIEAYNVIKEPNKHIAYLGGSTSSESRKLILDALEAFEADPPAPTHEIP